MQTQLGPRGHGYHITDDTGRSHYRRLIERPEDDFVLVDCDAGHTFAISRDDFRLGDFECPVCEVA